MPTQEYLEQFDFTIKEFNKRLKQQNVGTMKVGILP